MNKQDDPSTVRSNGDIPRGASWFRKLCAAVAAALLLAGGATTAHAVSGEQSGGQGYFTPPPEVCTATDVVLCDDRSSDEGILSCHQRSDPDPDPPVDQGFGVGLCTDTVTFLEPGQPFTSEITTTSFTDYNCYRDGFDNDVCLVCATFVEFGDGGRSCIQIANNGVSPSPILGVFGAFNIRPDSGSECADAIASMAAVFTAPAIGFMILDESSTIGDPGEKEVILCAGRSVTEFFGTDDGIVRGPEGAININTPYCYRSRTGRYVCF